MRPIMASELQPHKKRLEQLGEILLKFAEQPQGAVAYPKLFVNSVGDRVSLPHQ